MYDEYQIAHNMDIHACVMFFITLYLRWSSSDQYHLLKLFTILAMQVIILINQEI